MNGGLLLKLEGLLSTQSVMAPVISFLGGILASFSPCIYPLIPITLGIVGTFSSSKLKGILLSSIFVLGIAFIYTILGVISSLFGIVLSRVFSIKVLYGLVGVIFLILGLVQLEQIKLPSFSLSIPSLQKRGKIYVFLLGILSGLTLTPCIFPILGAILTFISLKRSIIWGAVNLFSFSLGYGFILIILGGFTQFIYKLPKTGSWNIIIKKFIGIILISVGIYFFIKIIR